MRNQYPYDYAVIRVVPKVDREEFINVGVIVSCPAQDFLAARIEIDPQRIRALDATLDLESTRAHLESIPAICAGGADSGPIGQMTKRQRFDWLIAPRSTVIQTSAAHSGACEDPAAALEHLLAKMVRAAG